MIPPSTFLQSGWYDGDILDAFGEDAKVRNTFLIQPVMSMQLTEEWKGYYYAVQDVDFGPEWQARLLFVPVLPAPEWSRKALF